MEVKLDGITYDIAIIDDDICLQSPAHDLVLENGWTMFESQAEQDFKENVLGSLSYRQKKEAGYMKDAHVDEYTAREENLISFVMFRFKELKTIIHE